MYLNMQITFPGQLAPCKMSLFSPVSSEQIIQPTWLCSSFSLGFLLTWSTQEKLKYPVGITNFPPFRGGANCVMFPQLQHGLHGYIQNSFVMPTVRWLIGQVGFHHAFLHSWALIITSNTANTLGGQHNFFSISKKGVYKAAGVSVLRPWC